VGPFRVPASTSERFEGPCTTCSHKATCASYRSLSKHLFERRSFQTEDVRDELDLLIEEACAKWLQHPGATRPPGRPNTVRLAAFFDLAASLLYAVDLMGERDGQLAFTASGIQHGDRIVFPYTWMCPVCIAEGRPREEAYLPGARRERVSGRPPRDYPVVAKLAKPRSRAIGDAGFKILTALLRSLYADRPALRLRTGGGRRGEFDMTLADHDALAFGEVKAKPLVCFPIAVKAPSDGDRHRWIRPDLAESFLHVSATNAWIPLGVPDGPLWPVSRLPELAAHAETVSLIEAAWYEHLEAYRTWTREPDRLRWLRFGCGNFRTEEDGIVVEKRVANTKELPGLDRTDDIKKGSAQLLLFTRLKFGCAKSALKGVLLGNTYAETHETEYLGPLSSIRLVDEDARTEFIFDAILGLTRNLINDQLLYRTLDGERIEAVTPPSLADV